MTLNHGGYLSSPIPDWLHQVIKLGTYPTTRGLGLRSCLRPASGSTFGAKLHHVGLNTCVSQLLAPGMQGCSAYGAWCLFRGPRSSSGAAFRQALRRRLPPSLPAL